MLTTATGRGTAARANALAASRHAVGGNFFGDLVEDITEFWDEVFEPIERNIFRPIGENLKEFERHNRETIQQVGQLAFDIAEEVGADAAKAYLGVPPGAGPRTRPPGDREAYSGGSAEIPAWVWWVGGGTAAALVVWAVVKAGA